MTKENNNGLVQPSLFDKISDFLNKSETQFRIIEIENTYSSAQISEMTNTKPSQEAKSLVILADEKPLMVILNRQDKIDFKKLKEITKTKNIKMATPEQVKEITNVEIGSVPPFGNLIGLPVYLSSNLSKETEIAFSAGLPTKIMVMKSNNFQEITNPIIGDYSKDQVL